MIRKYSQYNVIIGGDLNCDLFNRAGLKETLLTELIDKFDLYIANKCIMKEFTFCSKIDSTVSHLDYFIHSQNTIQIHNLKNIECSYVNTSAHSPIQGTIHCSSSLKMSEPPKQKERSPCKLGPIIIKWKEGDITLYQNLINERLTNIDLSTHTIEESLKFIEDCLMHAQIEAIPIMDPCLKAKRTHRKRLPRDLLVAIQSSKATFHEWKEEGRPVGDHPLNLKRLKQKKFVRTLQRDAENIEEEKLYTQIMSSYKEDPAIFNKLIKKQHNMKSGTAIMVDGDIEYNTDKQTHGWADYYESLVAKQLGHNDETCNELVNNIRSVYMNTDHDITLTGEQIEQAISRFNRQKAADLEGIQAEHFIYAPESLYPHLATLIRIIIKECNIPPNKKSGYKIPIEKRDRDSLLMGNHRGIVITAIMGKLIEHVIQILFEDEYGKFNSQLQCGFTEGKSPAIAILLLTEITCFAKANNIPLYIATLDAQKAFDVVDHDQLKEKLFHHGINGTLWCLLDNLYSEMTEVVKWKGQVSRRYEVGQGVGQGRIPSAHMYKAHIAPHLNMLEQANIGISIGPYYVGTPTVADDVILAATNIPTMQIMLDSSQNYANTNKYTLHPDKGTMTEFFENKLKTDFTTLKLGSKEMPFTNEFTHLGQTWKKGDPYPQVEKRIKAATGAAYLLIGKRVHGFDGLNPIISSQILSVYVMPRLLYGMEAAVLPQRDLTRLYRTYLTMCKKIQGMPERTANEAAYLLMDILPAEAQLHTRYLTFLAALLRMNPDSSIRGLSLRNLCLDSSSNSWFPMVRSIAAIYDIDIIQQIHTPRNKLSWKRLVKRNITQHWKHKLLTSAIQKSSLKYLNINHFIGTTGKHPIYDRAFRTYTRKERIFHTLRVRMLTGTYITQSTLYKFGICKSYICKLCEQAPEDLPHMLLFCKATSHIRSKHLPLLHLTQTLNTTDKIRLILNGKRNVDGDEYASFNNRCDLLCGELHIARNALINDYQERAVSLELTEDVSKEDLLILNMIKEEEELESNTPSKHDIINGEYTSDMCIHCQQIVADIDQALECEGRQKWQHISCQNFIFENEYNALLHTNSIGIAFSWICTNCTSSNLTE